jgi:hypothetical protein
MPINVCPIARVQAPVERVWALLSDPAQYSTWWDATTQSIEPEGLVHIGQVVRATSRAFARQWDFKFTVLAVDEIHHTLDLHTNLPLGVRMHNHFACTPIDPQSCQVSFG